MRLFGSDAAGLRLDAYSRRQAIFEISPSMSERLTATSINRRYDLDINDFALGTSVAEAVTQAFCPHFGRCLRHLAQSQEDKLMFKITAFAVGAMLVAGSAQAIPIAGNSTINFAGQSTCTATSCTFGNALVTSGTGDFAGFTFGNMATFFPFTFSPFTPGPVYTTTEAGLTTGFTVTSQLQETQQVVGGLTQTTVTDRGIASLTGRDDTIGVYTFTANQNGTIQGSFSATSTPVPEPASLTLLGLGLAGLGWIKRRRHA